MSLMDILSSRGSALGSGAILRDSSAHAVTQKPQWGRAQWRTPAEVKASYPKASILKGSRVVFNIKGNDYRLIASVQYQAGALAIRFFGTHSEYDKINAETV